MRFAECQTIGLTTIFRDVVDRSGEPMYAIARELGVSETTVPRCYTGKTAAVAGTETARDESPR